MRIYPALGFIIARLAELNSRYLVHPAPPLVVDPAACNLLSREEVLLNLEAHAKCNPKISVLGSHKELKDRLKEILAIRRMDMAVGKMLWAQEAEPND